MPTAEITEPQTTSSIDNNDANGAQPEDQVKTSPETDIALLKERYSHSSAEGKRLAEENKKLQDRLAALESRSLTKENTDNATLPYPSEASYIKHAVENGDKTEKEARLEYQKDKMTYDNQMALQQAIQAINNRQRFDSELQEKAYIEQSPEAQKAIEFASKFPEMERLPTVEKVARYREAIKVLGVKTEGRDLSAVKLAANGSTGGAGGRSLEAPNAQRDQLAKDAGYVSWVGLEACRTARTAEEHASLYKKYKLKN